MKKIPTLFRRDPENMSRVLREVNPNCQWVLDGEGEATRKYDGTCVLFDGTSWWGRREVKPGKAEPEGFRAEETDPETGKTVGWEPIEQTAFYKAFQRADSTSCSPGTYELLGPKVNGNPEGYDEHRLQVHAFAERLDEPARDFDSLMAWLLDHDGVYEGIVWHHPDGRMAKLKVRDAKATTRVT